MGRHRWIAAAVLLMMSGAGAQTANPPVLDEALDAPSRAHVINEFARRLTEQHVDGVRAKEAADDIRKRLARGEYDDQLTARSLAARVSRDVAAVAPDRHTYLEWVPYDWATSASVLCRRHNLQITLACVALKRWLTISAI